jgi:hypothetical protein
MNGWGWAGSALIVIGGIELVLFRYALAEAAGVKRNMRLLMFNSAFNVLLGAILLVIGLR